MLDKVIKEGASDKGKFSYMIRVDESESRSVVSSSLWPHGLYSPWNSLGQNTGVGSLSLLQGSSQPREWTQVSLTAGGFFTSWATREAKREKYKYEKEHMKNTLENQREILKSHERLFCTMLSNKYNLEKIHNCLGN